MLTILDILSRVLPHHLPKLRQGVRGVLLVVDRDGSVVAEIDPADGQQVLDVVLFDQGTEVVLHGLVSTAPQGTAIQLAGSLPDLEEDLLHLGTD
jgi:hypothetical protein